MSSDSDSAQTTSPDGLHVWLVNAWDVRMSHWIMGGSLVSRTPARTIFEAPHAWSFEQRTWLSNEILQLTGRRYPGRLPGITLTIDLRTEQATIILDDLAALQRAGSYVAVKPSEVPLPLVGPHPLTDVVRWLEAYPQE